MTNLVQSKYHTTHVYSTEGLLYFVTKDQRNNCSINAISSTCVQYFPNIGKYSTVVAHTALCLPLIEFVRQAIIT